jgi:hypothetical protein
MARKLIHRVLAHGIRSQVPVLGIAFQQAWPFEEATDPMGEGVSQESHRYSGFLISLMMCFETLSQRI